MAYHCRGADKTFRWEGKSRGVELFGQRAWTGGGKRIVVTEGELDMLSVAEAQGCTWPVVSLPNGAQSAVDALRANLEWLESFDEIVLWLDNDKAGQAAVKAAMELFTPGKATYIVAPEPYKDASDVLVNLGPEAVRKLVLFERRELRPDGIKSIKDDSLREFVGGYTPHCDATFPWPKFNEHLFGMRQAEVMVYVAESGAGKSSFVREIAYHLGMVCGQKVGIIALEESVEEFALFLTGLHMGKRLDLPGCAVSKEDRQRAFDELAASGAFELYDHFGTSGTDVLLAKMRYMVKGLGCKWIVFDHITLASGGNDSTDKTEHEQAQGLMKAFRALCQETGVGMHVIAQLRKSANKAFGEGGRISVDDIYGSGFIKQISNRIFGLERNMQADDHAKASQFHVRVLKDRRFSKTGIAGYMDYDLNTGRVFEIEAPTEPVGFSAVGKPGTAAKARPNTGTIGTDF